jgi:hypothetical protein
MSTETCPECGDLFEKDAFRKRTCLACWKESKRPKRRQPDKLMPGKQETTVVAWLAQIGESDEAIVGDVLALCRHDKDARQYLTGRAAALPHRPRGWKASLPVYPCHPKEPAPAPGGARGSLS